MEYFKIFGIDPPKLSLDLPLLEAKFHELSLMHHPDRNGGGSEAEADSVKVNLAYKILREPWSRALYILGPDASKNSKLPPALAEHYFQAQEDESPKALEELHAKLAHLKTEREALLNRAFDFYDQAKTSEETTEALRQIQNLVTENTYANSMQRDIDSKLRAR